MEPDVKAFLILIINTIAMGLIWLIINMTIGIYFNFAFFDTRPSVGNIIYYIFFLATFVLLIVYLRKKWKGWKEPGEE